MARCLGALDGHARRIIILTYYAERTAAQIAAVPYPYSAGRGLTNAFGLLDILLVLGRGLRLAGPDRELERAIQAAARDGLPMGLAVLDLDHFKEVNDAFGHEAGDAVLLTFADLVRRLTRRDDRLFRLGGDEFALLLPGADDEALLRVAQTVRQAMQMHRHEAGRGVTVSIGATTLRVGESARDWMHRADTAMYDAKRAGSNRVVVARAAGRPADAPSPA